MNLDSAKQAASLAFSNTYFEARQKFLQAAPGSRAYPCSVRGPGGEELFTDVAYFGDPKAKNLLVLVSGTHGAEGYCGSGGQLVFLQAGFQEKLPASTGVLMIHALNAYGFAWDRRVTAEGCDLNRNFVDFSKAPPTNAGYAELADHLVPEDMSPEGLKNAEAAVAAYRAEHGEWKFQEARKSGQYTHPRGMFYGGSEPTEARRTLEKIAADFDVASRERVVIVDYHTGLGPFGYGEAQCEQPSGLEGYERAVKIFGTSVTSPDVGNSSSIVIRGCQDEFWERELGDRHVYIALEFGTYDMENGRKVQRDDIWLFRWRPQEVDSELGRRIRAAARRHYYPQTPDWNEMVAWRCHQVHRQALETLAK